MEAKRLYYEMLRIRRIEERLIQLCSSGDITPLVHLSIGQEAGPVGVCSMLTRKDVITSTHRCHAHYLSKGGNLRAMLAELAGKKDGCSGGRGGSMLLQDQQAGVLLSSALVGGSIPIAVGAALSFQQQKKKNVAVAFFGDGAVEEGVFWESLNFASVHKLPVLFVCENNGYATHAPIRKRQPHETIYQRLKEFGLYSTARSEPNDVVSIARLSQKAIAAARNGRGPSFIEIPTYRLQEHWGPGTDWHLGYRTEKEGTIWIKRDPLKKKIPQFESKIKKEIEAAVQFMHKSPFARS
jgi:TPP-dependent pyruvate/acetoin dehydrogenase alpha subunit